jgi:hypothetical protein
VEEALRQPGQLAGDLLGRQHEVGEPGLDGGARHRVVLRRRRVLGDGDAAAGLDLAQPAMPSEPMPESTTPIPGPSGPLASE